MNLTVEALAKEIRQIDENYGAGDQLATALLPFIERHIAAGQPPKPASSVPLPEPGVADADGKPFAYWPDQLRSYGDAREAAGRAVADAGVLEALALRVNNLLTDYEPDDALIERDRIVSLIRSLPCVPAAPIPQQPEAEGAGKEAVGYKVTHVESSVAVGYYYLEIKTDDPPKIGSTLYTHPTPAADAGGVTEQWRNLLSRAIPFLRDEAGKYDDDGNEPLELLRQIEDTLTQEVRHG